MWFRSFKCSLVVVLFACAFLAGSGSASAGAHDGAGTSALSSIDAREDVENIPGAHDRHKGIRSYDSTGFPHDSNANRDIKSYGTPSGHGASHDHGTKGGGHGYNKNRDGCSKCKWENDDYWERDEPEEEGDENDGDECDDGQYRPYKAHSHGPGTQPGPGHKPGSHPSGVHKTGPIILDGVQGGGSPGGPSGSINYPNTGYTRPSGYESTLKPGSGWNTPFADASKPEYGSVNTGAFGTTPSSWPDWNRGTTPGDSGYPPKPAWGSGHDGRLPSSQGSGTLVPHFGVTSKPGQEWNQFPSGSSSAIPYAGDGISSPSNYGNPQGNQNRPYGQPGTQNTYAGAYAGATVTSGIGSPFGGVSNFEKKDHPLGLYKPVNTQALQGPYGGADQTSFRTGSDHYGLGGYSNPSPDSYSTPTTVTNTFGTTKRPQGGIGVTKPSYAGSTTSWLSTEQSGSGSSPWHSTGTTPHVGFPTSTTGFGTTKLPFNHVSIPSPTLSAPYDRTGSSSATASAGVSTFGTSPGTYSTPRVTATPSLYGTTPAYRGSSRYTPGVKGSAGSTRPAYGTVPHDTHPNIESDTWSGGQPGSSTGPWSTGKPGYGSGITPGRHYPAVSGILPGKQPQGTWTTEQPASGSGAWPNNQPGDGSGTWPVQVQPGHGSGSGCRSGGNCGDATNPQAGSSCGGCCVMFNCDGGCSGRGNVPAQGLCGGAGPSGVTKISYPAGTVGGNVPNVGITHRPDSPFNTGAGTKPVYPGTQGNVPNVGITHRPDSPFNTGAGTKPVYPGTQGNVPNVGITHRPDSPFNTGAGTKPVYPGTQGNVPNVGIIHGPDLRPGTQDTNRPVAWNTENPFLYGVGGGTPNDISHLWTTTVKPLGSENPFLIPRPKPGYSTDRNVIPLGEGNIEPIGQGKDSNGRGNIGGNPIQGVIPLGEKIPEGNNPFLTPSVGESDSGPSYDQHPDRTPGNYPGSGTPGNYPGSGTPQNYPGSGTPQNYPGSGSPQNYPRSGTPQNYPGSGSPQNYPRSGTPQNYPGSGTPQNYPGSGSPQNYPRSGTPQNYLGSGSPQNYPGSGTPQNYPGSGSPQNYPGSGTPQNYPGSGTPGNYPQSGGNPQVSGPIQCKLGLFGCGSPGSGSYAGNNHPGGEIGGNVGSVGNVPGGHRNPGIGPVSGHFATGAGGNNLAASGGTQAGAYSGSFSSAQASSSSFAGSYSGAPGLANNFGGNVSPAVQNQGEHNSWASSGASAYASSSAGSWSGNRPIDVKG